MTLTALTASALAVPNPAAIPEPEDAEPSLRPITTAAVATILIAIGGFFAWAFLASLDSAAVAPAVIIVDSNRKTVRGFHGAWRAGVSAKSWCGMAIASRRASP